MKPWISNKIYLHKGLCVVHRVWNIKWRNQCKLLWRHKLRLARPFETNRSHVRTSLRYINTKHNRNNSVRVMRLYDRQGFFGDIHFPNVINKFFSWVLPQYEKFRPKWLQCLKRLRSWLRWITGKSKTNYYTVVYKLFNFVHLFMMKPIHNTFNIAYAFWRQFNFLPF